MYLVLARKYRPRDFIGIAGQAHIVQTLTRAIREGKTAHAYLFCGPRGIGKTSMARILAKALNCEHGPTPEPDNECEHCREIAAGSSIDVLEIDGASNRGIDEIRNVRDNVNLRPSKSRYKIYIIDEVHSLTSDAFNALLKTLEEPPEYVKFIFATTAPEKILPTILSRCQRFDFRPLLPAEMRDKIHEIAASEKFAIEDDALDKVIEFSAGSMRDALSVLDQLIVFGGEGAITIEKVASLLGLVETESVERMTGLLLQGNVVEAVSLLHQLLKEGKDGVVLVDELVKKFRNIGYAKIGENDFFPEDPAFLAQFAGVPFERILEVITLALEYKEKVRRENVQVVVLEILLLKLAGVLQGYKREAAAAPADEPKPAAKPLPAPDPRPQPKPKPESVAEPAPEPETPAEEAPVPRSGGLEESWRRIMAEVKKSKPTAEAALREGKPEKIEGKELYVSYSEKFSFHRTLAEKPANKKVIDKAVSDVLGKDYVIVFAQKDAPQKSILEQPEVKEVINFFGGEVVELEE